MKILILTCFAVCHASLLLPSSVPHSTADLIMRVLRQNEFRSVVILSDQTSYSLQETARRINLAFWPTLSIRTNKVKVFNGPYNTFNYAAIAEEVRIYVIFLKSLENFSKELERVQSLYFWRVRHNTLVILRDVPTAQQIESSFKLCWKYWILNIVIVVGAKMYTYNPFPGQYSIEIDGDHNEQVFYDKLIDMNGYLIRMSVFPTALDAVPVKKGFVGRDADLSKALTHFLNATYSYVPPLDGITYGLKFKNGSMSGVFADVVQNVSDFTMNSRLVKLQFENVLEGSYPHDREDLACIVPKSPEAPEYQKFSKLFPKDVWILFFGGMVAFGFIWYFFSKGNTNIDMQWAFVDSYTLTLGNPIKDPTNIKLRLILLVYTSYLFFLLNAYKGLLTSILTVPMGLPEINTLDELDKSNLDIYAATRFKDMLQDNIGSALTPSLVSKVKRVPDDPDIAQVIARKGHYAVILKDTFAMRAVLDKSNFKNGVKIYRMMKEKPMPAQVCYAVRYGSPLLPRLNQLLRRFQESGLNEFWKSTIIRKLTIENMVIEDTGTNLRVLTLDNLSIAFFGLGFGLAAASIAFVAEFIAVKINCKKCARKIK